MDVREIVARQFTADAFFKCAARQEVFIDADAEEVARAQQLVDAAFDCADNLIATLAQQGYVIQKA